MIEAFWIPLLPPYLIGLVLSFLVEAMLTPRPVAPWRRPLAAVGVHVGVWTLAFALELMLFRRPYFAVANVLAIELVIVLVSNAKYQALREPFVYPDFEYFLDALKHPRLYLPFFGAWRALVAGGGYGLALWAGLALEDSVTAGAGIWLVSFAELPQEHMFDPTAPTSLFLAHTASMALLAAAAAAIAIPRVKVTFEAGTDVSTVGFITLLFAYRHSERLPIDDVRANAPFAGVAGVFTASTLMPDMVVIQSESFFDARLMYPVLRSEVLNNYDRIRMEASCHGRLGVNARGANTVRTEFGFLTGLDAQFLGVHQYNPYRKLVSKGFPTIASYLKTLGYRTICLHPYHRSFYNRDKILPLLGFDKFIAIEEFADAPRAGAYVADLAVGEKALQILEKEGGSQPVYLHVITMENHGPLHWESISESDVASTLNGEMPPGCQDLVAYGRHLRNADAMLSMLTENLARRTRPSGVCMFGDHVPIMPKVYAMLGEPDGLTNYVLWNSQRNRKGAHRSPVDLGVAELAFAFLKDVQP